MSRSFTNLYLSESKVQASKLLKALSSTDAKIQEKAYRRLQILAEFKDKTIPNIIDLVQHKHTLQTIALERKFKSWAELKKYAESHDPDECINLIVGGFLNKWFTVYDEAKKEQVHQGGYLFPYKQQFFICEADYIIQMGLDPLDEDWEKIAKDWVKPLHSHAKARLYKKLLRIQGGYHE